MKKIVPIFFLFIFFPIFSTYSQNMYDNLELGLFAGFEHFDKDADTDDDLIYGIRVGYNFADHLEVELDYGISNADSEPFSTDGSIFIADVTNTSYGLNFLWNFDLTTENVVPYIAIGAGQQKIKIELLGQSESDTGTRWNIGTGVRNYINKNFGLRLDIRAITYKVWDETYSNWELSLGVTYLF